MFWGPTEPSIFVGTEVNSGEKESFFMELKF